MKFFSHIKELGLKSPPQVPPQGGAGSPLAVEGVRGKGVKIRADAAEDLIWKAGVDLLVAAGQTEKTARSILGKHAKTDKAKLAQVIGEMAVSKPINPVAYLEKAMKPKPMQVAL